MLALDVQTANPRFRFGVWTGPGTTYAFSYSAQPLVLDRWYKFELAVRYSSGTDGLVRMWLDDVLVVNRSGVMIEPNSGAAMQVGYDSNAQLTNEVRFGNLRYTVSP
jgi:hypothetical protein